MVGSFAEASKRFRRVRCKGGYGLGGVRKGGREGKEGGSQVGCLVEVEGQIDLGGRTRAKGFGL